VVGRRSTARPSTPHTEAEIPDFLVALEDLRARVEAEVRAREVVEAKAEAMVASLTCAWRGWSGRRLLLQAHVLQTIMSIIVVWFGKNAEDLKKLGQAIAGYLN